jgi:hypothetical protein
MSESIEFTDRYGGRKVSWLRNCHCCEAMGYSPQPAEMFASTDEWLDAPFVVCPTCHGTARVSWFATVARVPRWLVKGARFAWSQIWALVDPTQPSQDRTFTQHGTGHDGVSGRYVGTYQVLDGRYVFHVFEDAA